MRSKGKRHGTAAFAAASINIAANVFLFALTLWVAVSSGSVALLSETFNSLTDIVSSIAIFVCVRISGREADAGHPFGHSRAEPVAGISVAVFAGILGFEVIRTSVARLITGGDLTISAFTLFVPVITAVLKGFMAFYFLRIAKTVMSPAIKATGTDSLCDVFVALAALIGVAGARAGYLYFDPVAGLLISVWIIYTGWRIGIENIDYLMGKAPTGELMEEVRRAALAVGGVKNINTVRAHYVGPFIHVEIHAEVAKYLSTFDSHAIGKEVERSLEKISAIEKAFVHIDPV